MRSLDDSSKTTDWHRRRAMPLIVLEKQFGQRQFKSGGNIPPSVIVVAGTALVVLNT